MKKNEDVGINMKGLCPKGMTFKVKETGETFNGPTPKQRMTVRAAITFLVGMQAAGGGKGYLRAVSYEPKTKVLVISSEKPAKA